MTAFCTLILLSCFLLNPSFAAINTITRTQSLKDPANIISSNNIFTLGFFSPPNSTSRYLGIWFTKPSKKYAFWIANRNTPVNDSSGMLMISKDGNLRVQNAKSHILWSTNVSSISGGITTAHLLDTGNLVLRSNGNVVWQSFDHPTDSILPNIDITITNRNQFKVLQSWKSPSDPSEGQFTAGIDSLTLPQLVVWEDRMHPHWRSGPWNGNILIGVQFNFIDFINAQLVISDRKQGTLGVTYFYPNKTLLSTYKLSSDGKMTQVWWDEGKMNWEVEWQDPETECDVYGKCGAFGTCNSLRPIICQCLRGFEPKKVTEWSRGDWKDGCVRTTKLKCENEGGKEDGFLRLKMMKVPDNAELRFVLNPDECRKQCLNNCSCLAYAYDNGIGCMTWSTNLTDIQEFSVGGVDLYLRLANSELGTSNNLKLIIALVGSSVGALAFVVLLCFFVRQRVHKQVDKKKTMDADHMTTDRKSQGKLEDLPLYELKTLAAATNNFHDSNKLGQGGFGSVYRGKLEDGQEIAVKRLSKTSGQGSEEFMNEVMLISKLQHRNLVRLLGCSVEGEEKMLVYEYMPNKSLDAILFVPSKQKELDWNRRFNIVEGICRGLQYLHRDSILKIIHRDLKASNILLDEDLNPKISDFGMARIFMDNEDEADTRKIVGTYGYMSPEYAMEGLFSEKSDVFSFGVLLLEIISGKKNRIFSDNDQCLSLLGYAWELWNEKNVPMLIDSVIYQPNCEKEILNCVHVALLCIQEFAKDRPSISTVISMLNGEISELPPPNKPGFAKISEQNSLSQQTQQDYTVNYESITEITAR